MTPPCPPPATPQLGEGAQTLCQGCGWVWVRQWNPREFRTEWVPLNEDGQPLDPWPDEDDPK